VCDDQKQKCDAISSFAATSVRTTYNTQTTTRGIQL
jgi:hypothetical protein